MKKVLSILMVLCFLAGCTGENHIENEISSEIEKGSYRRESIRIMNVDDEFYFDSGRVSDKVPRCGTLDGNLNKSVDEFEVPTNDGESNFEAEGFQSATGLSKEVPIGGEWVIFKKIDSYGENLARFKYVYKIRGTHPNAVKESEYIIFANSVDITFDMITKYFFSSRLEDHMLDISVVVPQKNDKWGICMYAEEATKTSRTLKIEQFFGYPMGTLQTGSWYEIERRTDNGWEKVEYIPSEFVRTWTSEALLIRQRDITEIRVDWENLYGELPPGEYRIGKKITDFIKTGEFTEDIYYAEFTIEEDDK